MGVIAKGEPAVPGVGSGEIVDFCASDIPNHTSRIALIKGPISSEQIRKLGKFAGALCVSTTKFSHVVKMLAQLRIPTIINLRGGDITEGTIVTIDGWSGEVYAGAQTLRDRESRGPSGVIETFGVTVRASISDPLHINGHRNYTISRYRPLVYNGNQQPKSEYRIEDSAVFAEIERKILSVQGEVWWRIETDADSGDWVTRLSRDQQRVLEYIERLATNGVQKVTLHLPKVDNADILVDFRTYLREKRSPLAEQRFGAMIETRSAIGHISSIIEAGVSYLVLGTADFLADILQLDRDNGEQSAAFSLRAPAALEALHDLADRINGSEIPLSVGLFDFQTVHADIETLKSIGIQDYFMPIAFLSTSA